MKIYEIMGPHGLLVKPMDDWHWADGAILLPMGTSLHLSKSM